MQKGQVTLGVFLLLATSALAEEFPFRAKYPKLTPISTEELAKQIGSSLVIDVRSEFEFAVMHIDGALHVDVSSPEFVTKLLAVAGGDKSKSIITYCNGTTCEKSYEAAEEAVKNGFRAVRVYDAGILAWARMARGRTLLFGKPIAPEAVISESQYEARLLKSTAFIAGATGAEALLIDVRDAQQREWTADFARGADRITLDELARQLQTGAFRKRAGGKTLYIFDNVGKQVRWLQYALNANGYEHYYFLQDGMAALAPPHP